MRLSSTRILTTFLIAGAMALPAAAGKHKDGGGDWRHPRNPRSPHEASSGHAPTSRPGPHDDCRDELERLRREIERLRDELERCGHRR